MIKVDNIDVYGWESSIRGMRSPMNSWDRSDTEIVDVPETPRLDYHGNFVEMIPAHKMVVTKRIEGKWEGVGENDIDLMKRLFVGGTEHRKYMRWIIVTMDINAPLYWWKEFDTYRVGVEKNSCSTMHKIHAKEFVMEDFSTEHLEGESIACLNKTIWTLNRARNNFLITKDKKYWWQMIQLLPSSYNQRRTVQINYEVVYNIIRQRENHKLDEWREFVEMLKNLPYIKEIAND